jgi:hypothetical protein
MAPPNKLKLMKNNKILSILYPSFISITPIDFPSNMASFIPEPITTIISITARTINGNDGGKLYVTVHGPIVEIYKNMVEIIYGRGKLTRISQKAS